MLVWKERNILFVFYIYWHLQRSDGHETRLSTPGLFHKQRINEDYCRLQVPRSILLKFPFRQNCVSSSWSSCWMLELHCVWHYNAGSVHFLCDQWSTSTICDIASSLAANPEDCTVRLAWGKKLLSVFVLALMEWSRLPEGSFPNSLWFRWWMSVMILCALDLHGLV